MQSERLENWNLGKCVLMVRDFELFGFLEIAKIEIVVGGLTFGMMLF